jgi:hypothetical protein
VEVIMSAHLPAVGEWYCIRGGELFEVVALDETDGTLEIQYFDGTIEEMELVDWEAQYTAREIEEAEAPEDWSGSVDADPEDERRVSDIHDDRRMNAMGGEGLDLFD